MKFHGSESLGPITDSGMAEILDEFGEEEGDSSEFHIVILDGILFYVVISTVPATSWFLANQSKRRLILISSDAADRILSASKRDENEVCIFGQRSWDYQSYKTAGSIPEFWNHVESVIDSPQAPDVPEHLSKTERRLWNNYYFAGGNARWIFQYSTKRV